MAVLDFNFDKFEFLIFFSSRTGKIDVTDIKEKRSNFL